MTTIHKSYSKRFKQQQLLIRPQKKLSSFET
jgi:hypothetical protein